MGSTNPGNVGGGLHELALHFRATRMVASTNGQSEAVRVANVWSVCDTLNNFLAQAAQVTKINDLDHTPNNFLAKAAQVANMYYRISNLFWTISGPKPPKYPKLRFHR